MAWLPALRRYFAIIAVANVVWEFAHLPLYTIWIDEDWGANAFAAIHCAGGDILIAAAALLSALIAFGRPGWPQDRFILVAAVAIVLGLAYAILSEWLNVEVRKTWAYRDIMPTLPLLGTGLSPVLQWLVVPAVAFSFARRRVGETG